MTTMTDEEPKLIPRIPISEAYKAGREACKRGADYFTGNPYEATEVINRLDWSIGWDDEFLGIAVERRADVEAAPCSF